MTLAAGPPRSIALLEPSGPKQLPRPHQHFTRCGPGRGTACVIDGDTFKLGQRKVRIVGIDAPETHPASCPEDARMGEAATFEWMRLLNQGPVTMNGRIDDSRHHYARDLRERTVAWFDRYLKGPVQ